MSRTDDPTTPGYETLGYETLGYEAARDELAEVVRTLEAGGLPLEDSLALWERGEQLAAACERHLAGARERIESVITAREHRDAQPPTVG